MARFQLNAATGGINRQRIKGGPKPDTLYDGLNCYVDENGAVVSRPGSIVEYALPPGTIGMCAFAGGLVVFSHQVVDGMPDGVTCEVLPHPGGLQEVPLRRIHYAGPFLGALYVTAEFADGTVRDYWLQNAATWQPGYSYGANASVQPSEPNGFTYRANRIGSAGPVWAPNVERQVGYVVEPTVFNGFEYVCVQADGLPPRSGATEPAWPTVEGAAVVEEADAVAVTPPQSQTPPPSSGVPPRYDNPGGSAPRGVDNVLANQQVQ